jgi:phenol 2-monooxygenase (NADPH)
MPMQFHLNGFRPGNPEVSPSEQPNRADSSDSPPAEVDVLIIGAGPTGLTLAAQLAAFPSIKTCVIEQKSGPLQLGQADGIACRTMEMFESFGFSERVLKESYWVNETSFWKPDERHRDNIVRSGTVQDTEDGLSEFPHVILNQARVHDFLLETMRNSVPRLQPTYARRLIDLTTTLADPTRPETAGRIGSETYPVTVKLERLDPAHLGQVETVRARFVVGCDGARSKVRSTLGRNLRGDSANQAWGVMDVLAITDFPDIRRKAAIHSADHGSALIIPREGGYLVRLYIELDELAENERVADRSLTVERLIAAAQRILHPYTLEVKEVAWWSIYEIGQRLCDSFDDLPEGALEHRVPHVFIAGDACHTHSPKAGQGMNVSVQDSFNLGWKLASVLLRRCDPKLLRTYSTERRAVARELIDFDREFARMFSAAPKDADDPAGRGVDPGEFQKYFIRHAGFTAGIATQYAPSLICAVPTYQYLARGLRIGTRFHSAPVIRLADARPIQLGHVVKADGRWRLFLFAGEKDPLDCTSVFVSLCEFLAHSTRSPVLKYTRGGDDIDSVIDVRAVFQQDHRELELAAMPDVLLPRKGRYGLRDYEKIFCVDPARRVDIFAMRVIDRQRGCVVIVRPDQYVAHILPLDAHAQMTMFFDRFMLPAAAPA